MPFIQPPLMLMFYIIVLVKLSKLRKFWFSTIESVLMAKSQTLFKTASIFFYYCALPVQDSMMHLVSVPS